MKNKTFPRCAMMLAVAVLAGCAHPIPTLHGRDVVISASNTTPDDATRRLLFIASRITLDHGYRYFEVITPIRPGAKVTIRLYEAGEALPASPNVHDALLGMVNHKAAHEQSPEEGTVDR